MNFKQLFEDFQNIKVGVIGDVMLDTYMWGNVERISPEAPVPVLSVIGKEYRIGGAGNVALNLASLGAKASIISITGNDDDGQQLKKMFEAEGILTQYLSTSANRITTNKTLFEDYNKGVLTEKIITEVIRICQNKSIITAVDPKRKHFFSYVGVDIFKPNLKEVKEGLQVLEEGISLPIMDRIHEQLHQKLAHGISLITLSEHGAYFSNGNKRKLIPSHRRNIADVSGAGDTVVAVASLVYAATKNVDLMGEMANIAGGLVCEEVGTVAINRERLYEECIELLGSE